MKKQLRYILLLPLVSSLVLLGSCTDPGLEMETPMSHMSNVRFGYDWSAAGESTVPDSMLIMAVRVINHYKRGMMMSTENLRGHYIYNAPENIEAWVDPSIVPPPPPPPRTDNNYTIDPTEPYNGGDEPSTFEPEEPEEVPETASNDIVVDHFTLPEGTYKFYAVGVDKNIYDHAYHHLQEYMAAEGTGMQYSEVEMVYNTHSPEEDDFTSLLAQDYNQGFDFIQPDYPAIFIDRLELKEIPEKQELAVTFTPKPLTQNIAIWFNIDKDVSDNNFTIEKVVGEISGIPCKATAFDGHLTLSKTNKMQFSTTLTDLNGTPLDEDSPTNTQLRVHANINVLSILHSSKPTDLTGPGIMQLAITYKLTKVVNDEPKEITRVIFGKLNLYNVLKEANLISYSSDSQYATKSCDHAVLDIPMVVKLSPEGVLSGGDDSHGGFSNWEQCGDATTPDNGGSLELY